MEFHVATAGDAGTWCGDRRDGLSLGSGFVGRAAELAQRHLVLHDRAARLFTLTGPSGIGKTRCTPERAAIHGPHVVVSLAAVLEPALLAEACLRCEGGRRGYWTLGDKR